tara:strand:+ start:2250 stop:2501 length:252 start_codon:yes stop_codon:yes gene_type:complete
MGILDILLAFSLIFIKMDVYLKFVVFLAVLVAIKAFIFFDTLVSVADFISVLIIILSIIFGANFFLILVAIWLLQKGIFSLFS